MHTSFKSLNPKLLMLLLLSVVCMVLVLLPGKAFAATFNPGRIIDDAVFYNASTMSTSQIQSFLNSKVPNCDTQGEKMYNSTQTRAEYGRSRNNPPPYICLKDYQQSTPQVEAASGKCEAIASSNSKSSARIINDVAKACGVNPQVLLVLLQKEQSLVTDDWPWKIQYEKATGFACPDTSPCDPSYEGFFYQVYNAALQYKIYRANPGNYNYLAHRNNNIHYHPDLSRCGSSTVYIQNQATAGLYNYTPYQPNQASLDSYPGTGNSCSSYGNRNFWFKFRGWFGSTYAGKHHAAWQGQSAYPSLRPGESQEVYITYRNNGSETWYDDVAVSNGTAPSWMSPVRLATNKPVNRRSVFGSSWPGNHHNRATGLFAEVYKLSGEVYATNPHKVEPGESAKFKFNVSVPENYPAGSYNEYFVPLVEGGAVMNDSVVFIKVIVEEVYDANYKAQSSYPTLKPGESGASFFEYKNTGNTAWYDKFATNNGIAPSSTEPIQLRAYPDTRNSILNTNWPSEDIASTNFSRVYKTSGEAYSTNPHRVEPGESVRISFDLTVPDGQASGVFKEDLRPYKESEGYLPVTTFLNVTIPEAATAKPGSNTKELVMNPLSEETLQVSFKNTGNITWQKETTDLNVQAPGLSSVRGSGWISDTVSSRMNEATVSPGGMATFNLPLEAPADAYEAILTMSPRVGGSKVAIYPEKMTVKVPEPNYQASFRGQSAYPTLKQNTQVEAYFLFKNTGNIEWHDAASSDGGPNRVVLASTNRINRISKFNDVFDRSNRPAITFAAVYESDGQTLTSNQHVAQPGEIIKFEFNFDTPDDMPVGTYREWFQPVLEGGNPWSMGGKVFLDVTVEDATYKAKFRGQTSYPTIAPGDSKDVYFLFENTGNTRWLDNDRPAGIQPVRLANTNPINRNSMFTNTNRPVGNFDAVYKNDGSTLADNQDVVSPGEVVRMKFTFKAPPDIEPGKYREWFQPVLEGGNPWRMDGKVFLDVTVPQ